ncbi:PREDICTED: scarecrow-like protein 13 [Fragaria vesca subsp. vesca]|uniref:scarecrow-like protein 13 n=1 Tax=Fragaria vesca subsp. vesca TaxID=101020 RepID=UPI0002C3110B|nr:PREDICTED: scarecrow-like protein 13 [Fragaria vesca subsp. vesca]XP_011460052.1 PREDICTED: scarecrow-like protein 13 [Fragaria vesca subsp. vesca]
MQTSQQHRNTAIHMLHHQPMKKIDPYSSPHFQILENSVCPDTGSQGKNVSFQTDKEEFFTLESTPVNDGFIACDSPSAISGLSNRSPFSPQGSHSYSSDHHHHHFSDTTSGSPVSGCSGVDDGNDLKYKLRELEVSLLGPESDIVDSHYCCYKSDMPRWSEKEIAEMIPKLNLKNVLIHCAHAISEEDMYTAANCMEVLGHMVSVSGEPMQRLGAYMLEGLKARLEKSGSMIYKTLKCEVPTSEELMTYMSILYQICPYWKFAYLSSNVIIRQALLNESRVHIIDFQIAQGSQWIPLIQDLACQPGGPPLIRITGVDDTQSNHARGGGLHIVGKRLSEVAAKYNVPFQFNAAAMSGCEVDLENLRIQPGEAIAVTFPYVLHHMPDESVSTENHRDRLLRLVRSLSPKVMTLVEQESNTNTSSFYSRFVESVDYYTAMFESIDAGCARDNTQRINAEMHCVARDIVNMIACEDAERVERHELLGKWRSRLMMDGFTPCPFGPAGIGEIRNLLKDNYDENYRVEEVNGALYLGWKKRALVTSSAWRCAY